MNPNSLIISHHAIRQDAEGRFCLNDLHKAAGGEQKHRPKYWLKNQQTQEVIAELSKGGIPPIFVKQGLGTFVVKELVYLYAMWISPAFMLQVIRAYDALIMQTPLDFSLFLAPITEPLTRADYDWRKMILTKACENLDNAPVWQVVLGKDLADD